MNKQPQNNCHYSEDYAVYGGEGISKEAGLKLLGNP